MRLKNTKQAILTNIENNLDYGIKSRIAQHRYGSGSLSELEQAVVDIAKAVVIESFTELMNNIYTDEEFENDLQLSSQEPS